jgi:hypothetical protein
MSRQTKEALENIPELSIKGYTFEVFGKKVFIILKSNLLNIFSDFFKSINNLEDWDKCYDKFLRESIILNTGIIEPIKLEKIMNSEKSGNIRFSAVRLFDLQKIKDFYFIERRNKLIENLLKN